MRSLRARYASVLETLNFLWLWFQHPRSIGAVLPSSDSLAAAVAREVDFATPGVIVELGGGTGSITRALVENATEGTRIVVIEREPSLCALLSSRFPDVRVICGDACRLGALLKEAGIGQVRAIVSGLPLLTLPDHTRRAIVRESFAVLASDGVFVQFTYGPAAPVRRALADEAGFIGRRLGWILRNLPPASLWCYSRQSAIAEASV